MNIMNQNSTFGLPLFDMLQGLSRKKDPISSHEAGSEIVSSGIASRHCKLILSIMSQEQKTNCEHAELAGLTQNQITRRMTEIERSGLVERGAYVTCPILGRRVGTWKLR